MINKVIIIGGTGQLGIYLAKLLLKKKYQVILTSRDPKKFNKSFQKKKF